MSKTKNALITGAGSGIGQACVIRLLDQGYRVWAVGRRMSALEETKERVADKKEMLELVAADVSDRQGLYDALKNVGPITALIANAGICERTWLNEENSDAIWDTTMGINLTGVWNTFRAVVDRFAPQSAAVIVSSGLGKLGRPGYGAYTASKHAVLGMVKCFAPELAPKGVRVNGVCPGWVDTDMAARDLEITAAEQDTTVAKAKASAVSSIPLKRFVTAKEVANLTWWLLSDESSAVTGQSYNISCGEFTV